MNHPDRRKEPDLSVVSKKLDTLITSHERVNVALFATDSNNEFKTAGVMTVMQKIDTHIDVMCSIARWFKKVMKFAFWLLTGLGSTLAAGRAAGWW